MLERVILVAFAATDGCGFGSEPRENARNPIAH
jgi:hypothetical protein